MPVTLLAVDDSVTMRKVLEMTFAGEDYRVVTADSADAALALARSARPGIVVADTTLEGKSGYDLCQALKRELPNVPVVLLSSKLHPYDAAKGQASRADDHVDKPFDTQQLIDKIRSLVTSPKAAAPGVPARPRAPQPPAAAQRPAAPLPARPPFGLPQPPAAARPPVAASPARPAAPVPQPAAARAPAPSPARPPVAPHSSPQPPAVAHAAAAPVVAAALDGDMAKKLAGIGLSKEQVDGVLALSREVVERVVWEVVPMLAETMIKEEIRRLTAE